MNRKREPLENILSMARSVVEAFFSGACWSGVCGGCCWFVVDDVVVLPVVVLVADALVLECCWFEDIFNRSIRFGFHFHCFTISLYRRLFFLYLSILPPSHSFVHFSFTARIHTLRSLSLSFSRLRTLVALSRSHWACPRWLLLFFTHSLARSHTHSRAR